MSSVGEVYKMRGQQQPDNVRFQVEVVGLGGTLLIENVSKREPITEIIKTLEGMLMNSTMPSTYRV
jgi:hypothetical protein